MSTAFWTILEHLAAGWTFPGQTSAHHSEQWLGLINYLGLTQSSLYIDKGTVSRRGLGMLMKVNIPLHPYSPN